jgi:deoxyribodipyrimidine photo-lyase
MQKGHEQPTGDVPSGRIRAFGPPEVRRDAAMVVYWMNVQRRANWNFALDRAVDWAKFLQKPLLIVEPLGCESRWASERHHRFVLRGMLDNERKLADAPVRYLPYLERNAGEGRKLFAAVAKSACLVVADDYPLPAALDPESLAAERAIRLEKIDGTGILPMSVAPKAFETAYSFRRFLQAHLREHVLDFPKSNSFSRIKLPILKRLPPEIAALAKTTNLSTLVRDAGALECLPIDHSAAAVELAGGSETAKMTLKKFLERRLARYHEKRSDVEDDVSSGLSPYLHFGHISAHEVFHALAKRESWTPEKLTEKASGKREGWWGMSEAAEAFLDELVTWREVGLNFCRHRGDYARYDSLPDWALTTLKKHSRDKRAFIYSFDQFDAAATHDPLWNAAQRQLRREGKIHNYLRMLWGKKILEWSASPKEAAETMIELNNRYALDGDDPNSYSGIFWVLGRYDRPWGPERVVFGTVRYMSSENTARKMRVSAYLERFAE